ncbi:MAG: hypothetical protein ACFFDQ_09760 [Candidatus Thorarchaeota archaeon]
MQAKPVFLLTTIVGLFFGITMMIVPSMILDLLGASYLDGGLTMGRHAASWILAAAVFAFLVRNAEHSDTRQAIFILFDLAFILMVVAELFAYFTAAVNIMMWAIIALHVLFVILYTYLFITNR